MSRKNRHTRYNASTLRHTKQRKPGRAALVRFGPFCIPNLDKIRTIGDELSPQDRQTSGLYPDPSQPTRLPNRAIEIHDSVLANISFSQLEAQLHFSSVYLQQSEDVPGRDAGRAGYRRRCGKPVSWIPALRRDSQSVGSGRPKQSGSQCADLTPA
jgi:hypothetical protein